MSLQRTTLRDEEYLARCAKRTSSAPISSRSVEFYEGILIGSLSSIRRRKYARVVDAAGLGDGFPRTTGELNALLERSMEIIPLRNPTVEHVVNRGESGGN